MLVLKQGNILHIQLHRIKNLLENKHNLSHKLRTPHFTPAPALGGPHHPGISNMLGFLLQPRQPLHQWASPLSSGTLMLPGTKARLHSVAPSIPQLSSVLPTPLPRGQAHTLQAVSLCQSGPQLCMLTLRKLFLPQRSLLHDAYLTAAGSSAPANKH